MRRVSYRRRVLVGLLAFVVVFSFVFLKRLVNNDNVVEAANLSNFDPGYIMSDYQMSNYNSMTEAEIQAWLTAKNPCANTDYDLYVWLSSSTSLATWHWADGHFVCISEELFGDGEVIGAGETAAHIIWQAAQDFQINPQVLLVLLQKENSLITDDVPNSWNYRTATGYGCPDTAACSSKYYGFKNQIRNAAALFRDVLSGGWTNYPLGENYIRFSPHCDSGTVVNIRSLATSALYRYTPYQPNAAVLAAGYGTVPGDACAAYGNRNFYSFFEDWFGGITKTTPLSDKYDDMVVPRILYVKKGSRYINPETSEVGIRSFSSFEFFNSLNYDGDKLCLAIGKNKNCYLYSDLEELETSNAREMAVSRMLIVKKNTKFINYEENIFADEIKADTKIVFDRRININGELCLIAQGETENKCVLYSDLNELPEIKYSNMAVPRYFYIPENTNVINTKTGITTVIDGGEKSYFEGLTYWFGELCLKHSSDECILYNDLRELNKVEFRSMAVPRYLMVSADTTYLDAEIGIHTEESIASGSVLFFDKLMYVDGQLCLKDISQNGTENGCILYTDLVEINNFTAMSIPRYITVVSGAKYYDLESGLLSDEDAPAGTAYFVDKITADGNLCLRTRSDSDSRNYRCILYTDLSE
ncbi:hypothetical protein IKT18_00275 [Candidatus Saccharibacteria bacterium]|nr:hypothetical protein [Candidatus Saccharibacteria bacterium]